MIELIAHMACTALFVLVLVHILMWRDEAKK